MPIMFCTRVEAASLEEVRKWSMAWTDNHGCALVGGKNLNPERTIRGSTTENA